MAKQAINVGVAANDRKGDSLRAAFQKINANFTEVYTALGLSADTTLNLGNFVFEENTVRLTNSNNDDSTATTIVIAQPITTESDLTVGGDIIPSGNIAADIGSPTKRFRDLYLSSNTIYLGATSLGVDNVGNLLIGGQAVADVGTAAWANITGKPTFAAVATSGSYDDLSDTPTIPTAVSELANDAGYITAAEAAAGITVNPTGDLKGSVFADDSTLLVDATNGVIPWSVISGAAAVATSGSYNDLSNKPTIPTLGNFSFSANNITASSGAAPILLKIFGGDAGDPPALISKEWSFNTNGSITFPDGTIQPTAFLGGSPAQLENGSYTVVLGADGGLTLPTGFIKPSTTDKGLIIEGPNYADWVELEGGGYNTISNGVNIVTHRGLTNEERMWSFANDGALYPPFQADNYQIGTIEWRQSAPYEIVNQIRTTVGNGVDQFPGLKLFSYANPVSNDHAITLQAGFNHNWIFKNDGSLTLPGDIKSEGNINIDINLSDSTLRRWTFGEDGILNLPNALYDQGSNNFLTLNNGSDVVVLGSNISGEIQITTGGKTWQFNSTGNLTAPGNIIVGGILQIEDGVHEKFAPIADATGVVNHDYSTGHIFYHTSPDANWTINLTNLNLASGYATTVTIIIEQGETGFYPSALQIGGAAQTINWQGNTLPTPSTSRTDVVTFSIFNNSGTYTVLGQLAGF